MDIMDLMAEKSAVFSGGKKRERVGGNAAGKMDSSTGICF